MSVSFISDGLSSPASDDTCPDYAAATSTYEKVNKLLLLPNTRAISSDQALTPPSATRLAGCRRYQRVTVLRLPRRLSLFVLILRSLNC